VAGIVAAVRTQRARVVFLASPNNPTGGLVSGMCFRLRAIIVIENSEYFTHDKPFRVEYQRHFPRLQEHL
jgi:aspartate/methionine/tyrosine aminotransferase